MNGHLSSLLIISTVLLAACQPSQGAIQTAGAQTQAVQDAFNAAVAGAQTHAGPTRTPAPTWTPVPTLTPTAQPGPTGSGAIYRADLLALMEPGVKTYLEGTVNSARPSDGSPYSAQVLFVKFESYDEGRATVMDVGVQKSDDTREGLVYGAVLQAFTDMYSIESGGAVLSVPTNVRVFRVHIYDASRIERFMLTGQWADVHDYATGSLSKDDFLKRLKYQLAVH